MRTFDSLRENFRHESFGGRVFRLLNRPRHGKFQDDVGGYGRAFTISRKDFEANLRGDCSVALSAVDNRFANFLAFDIDEQFLARLPVVSSVLRRNRLDRAAFAVSGSSTGRGKVVVSLAQRIPQSVARRLVFRLLGEMQHDADFGSVRKGTVSVYPTGGDGSFVRIFGRNRQRSRHSATEVPMDLDGNLSDLYYVEAAIIEYDAEAVHQAGLSAWAREFISCPFTGNTAELWRSQVRLAGETATLYGSDAERRLSDWFFAISEISPQMKASTRRQLLRPEEVAPVF